MQTLGRGTEQARERVVCIAGTVTLTEWRNGGEAMKRFIPHGTFEVLEAKRMNAANLIGNALAAMPATSSTVQTSTSGSGAANLSSNLNQTSAGVNAGGSTAGSVNAGVGALNAGANVAGSTHSSAALSGTGQGIVNLVNGLANGGTHANFVVHVS